MFKPSAEFFKKTTSNIGKTLQKVPSLINSYNRIHAIVNTQKEENKLVA